MIYLILFIVYTTSIFFISNPILIGACALINITLVFALKINFKRVLINIAQVTPIILITFIFNILFGYFKEAILIAIRLYIVCNITFIFTYKMGITNIFGILEKIFSKDISLMINIAFTFIPVIFREIETSMLALQSKGLKRNSISSIKYTFKLLLISIFKKTNEIELTLKNKNYVE